MPYQEFSICICEMVINQVGTSPLFIDRAFRSQIYPHESDLKSVFVLLINYRFSTTSLASGNDINLKYQDLAFKLNFPTRKAGTFSIWGLGLLYSAGKAPL